MSVVKKITAPVAEVHRHTQYAYTSTYFMKAYGETNAVIGRVGLRSNTLNLKATFCRQFIFLNFVGLGYASYRILSAGQNKVFRFKTKDTRVYALNVPQPKRIH